MLPHDTPVTPYALVSAVAPVASSTKPELLRLTRRLERAAVEDRPQAVAACLQDARFLTDRTLEIYRQLAPARLHARGLQAWLAEGVEGVALDDDNPLVDEWVMVLPIPGRPVAFAARDHGTDAWTWAQTSDPDVVAECGRLLGLA